MIIAQKSTRFLSLFFKEFEGSRCSRHFIFPPQKNSPFTQKSLTTIVVAFMPNFYLALNSPKGSSVFSLQLFL